MIVVDTSALIAVLLQEKEKSQFLDCLLREPVMVGAPIVFEAHLVITRRGWAAQSHQLLNTLLEQADAEIVAFDLVHLAAARHAFDRFGKGVHPAALNYGDCMSYALAKTQAAPLLFKGGDFAKTDIEAHPLSALA